MAGDQVFAMTNKANPGIGQITVRSFGNINAAQNALKIDTDISEGYTNGISWSFLARTTEPPALTSPSCC